MTQKICWVDTHCHLEMLKEDPGSALEKAQAKGVGHCLTIGTDHQSNQKVRSLAQTFRLVSGALGVHPHHAKEAKPEHFEYIEEGIEKDPKVLAVGECGLDFHYTLSEKEIQKQVFVAQLELAIKHQVPVVIHSRSAEQETLDCLAQVDVSRLCGVFHSFTASLDMAQEVLGLGFFLGFNGICTFPKSAAVRAVLKETPKDRLLLETDSPYLAPVPFRGKANVPANVAQVGQFVAQFLGMESGELAQVCTENSQRLFGIQHVD